MKAFAGQQFADDVGVDGFIRVHRPLAQLRQADSSASKAMREKAPSGFWMMSEIVLRSIPFRIVNALIRRRQLLQAAGLPHTSTSM